MMQSISDGSVAKHRFASLDSLRGMAAFIVMVGHALPRDYLEAIWRMDTISITRIFMSGYQCVILFFVLSGFALYLMFDSMKKDAKGVSLFLLARWIRLYPVYFVSIVFSMAVYLVALEVGGGKESPYLANNPMESFSLRDFMGHLTLIGVFDAFKYNPPIWSIVHEMRISLLFPVLFLLVIKFRVLTLVPTIVASLIVSFLCWGYEPGRFQELVTMPYIGTVHYMTFFIFGALIAHFRGCAVDLVQSISGKYLFCIYFIVVFSFLMMGTFPGRLGEKIIYDWLAGILSAGIIVLVLSSPGVLGNFALVFLGKISFSLYLMHNACIIFIHMILDQIMNEWLIFVISLLFSVLLSALVWWAFERPSLRASRAVRRGVPVEEAMAKAG